MTSTNVREDELHKKAICEASKGKWDCNLWLQIMPGHLCWQNVCPIRSRSWEWRLVQFMDWQIHWLRDELPKNEWIRRMDKPDGCYDHLCREGRGGGGLGFIMKRRKQRFNPRMAWCQVWVLARGSTWGHGACHVMGRGWAPLGSRPTIAKWKEKRSEERANDR